MVRALLLAGVACLALRGASAAQTPGPAPAATSGTTAAPVDTSALAYYASKHDSARVEAELRRLRTLYPNWQPPADPMAIAPPPSADNNQPLWDLFGADKLDELDAEIARRKAADPAFAPPPELVSKVAAKRTRQAMIAASDRKDYTGVLDLAARNPDLVSPDDLDLSWRVAEAYGRTGAPDKALKINQDLLGVEQDPADRLATLRKAMLVLPPADVEKLVALGKPGANGRSEFEAVDLDLARQRVGKAIADNTPDAAAQADVAKIQAAAARPDDARDAALLGWLASRKKDWPQATTWFKTALAAGPDPAKAGPDDAKVAQGAALALRESGHPADAESLAYTWRNADPALALLYIGAVTTELTKPKPPAIDAERLKQFSDVVLQQQSGDGAQALGWYAYNVKQYKASLAWFNKAMAWQPRDSTALGLALSLKQNKEKDALAAFLADKGPTFPSLAALTDGQSEGKQTGMPTKAEAVSRADSRTPSRKTRPTDDAGLSMAPGPDSSEPTAVAPRPGRRAAARGSKGCTAAPRYGSGSSALQAGWCLLSLNRPQEAAVAFSAARESSATRVDASYGQALADLRSNRTDEAVAAADSVPQTLKRRSEIGLAALAQTASRAFDEGRYRDTLQALDRRRQFETEPRDLAILRAWSVYHLDHRDEARRMFSVLDGQLSTAETRSGIAATNTPSRY